jgi:hypothetical protein
MCVIIPSSVLKEIKTQNGAARRRWYAFEPLLIDALAQSFQVSKEIERRRCVFKPAWSLPKLRPDAEALVS